MKYGVVSRDRILKDLLQWTDMYGAGRLHKPVKILKSDEEIENAIVVNRENAVRTGAYSDVYFLCLLTHSLTYTFTATQRYYFYRVSSTRPKST